MSTETNYEKMRDLANSLMAQDEFGRAIELYNVILQRYPTDWKILYNRSLALFKLGRQAEAFSDVERLIICLPNQESDCVKITVKIICAFQMMIQGDIIRAAGYLRQAHEMDPAEFIRARTELLSGVKDDEPARLAQCAQKISGLSRCLADGANARDLKLALDEIDKLLGIDTK